MGDFGWILLAVFLLAKSGAGGSGQPLLNPTQQVAGGSVLMAGSVGIPALGAALNGLSRPLTGSFGLSVGGPQSDPTYGNPGAAMFQLGASVQPGFNLGLVPTYSVGGPSTGPIVTSYDQLVGGNFSSDMVVDYSQLGIGG